MNVRIALKQRVGIDSGAISRVVAAVASDGAEKAGESVQYRLVGAQFVTQMVLHAFDVLAEFAFAVLNAGAQDDYKYRARGDQPEHKGENVIATVALMAKR